MWPQQSLSELQIVFSVVKCVCESTEWICFSDPGDQKLALDSAGETSIYLNIIIPRQASAFKKTYDLQFAVLEWMVSILD